MSSTASSPQRFSGTYDSFYHDAAAAASAVTGQDINTIMKVPKRLRVTGEHDDSPSVNWANLNKAVPDKIQMNVPERIMVAGGENHISSRGVPREFELEESLLPRPPDPALFRINTPPRTITLQNYVQQEEDTHTPSSPQSSASHPPSVSGHATSGYNTYNSNYAGASATAGGGNGNFYDEDLVPQQSRTPSTLGAEDDATSSHEMKLMRRQVDRLNHRLMALESDAQQRSQRELIIYTLGVAYCLFRLVLWLNRSWLPNS